jgi:hypothetical protein
LDFKLENMHINDEKTTEAQNENGQSKMVKMYSQHFGLSKRKIHQAHDNLCEYPLTYNNEARNIRSSVTADLCAQVCARGIVFLFKLLTTA